MATIPKNKSSQSLTARIPNDIFESMEAVKQDGESNAAFIVNAMRGEIARRQTEGCSKNPLVTALDALSHIEEMSMKTSEVIKQLIEIAHVGLGITYPSKSSQE